MNRILILSLVALFLSSPICWAQRLFDSDAAVHLAFSPNSKVFASSHQGIRLWSIRGKLLATINDIKNKSDEGAFLKTERLFHASIAFNRDGKILAAAGKDGVKLFDVENPGAPKEIPFSEGKEADVRFVAFSADGAMLAWRSKTQISIWHVKDKEQKVHTIKAADYHNHYGIAFDREGRLLAWATPKQVFVWNVKDRTRPTAINVEWAGAPAFSPKENILAWRELKRITLWDTGTQKISDHLDVAVGLSLDHTGGPIFSPEGKRMVTTGLLPRQDGTLPADPTAFIIDVDTGLITRSFPRSSSCMAFSPNGEILVTGDQTGMQQHYVGPHR